MCIKRVEEPHAVFETEFPVGESAHGAYVNHVSGEIVCDCFLDVGGDFGGVAPVEYAVYTLVGKLVGNLRAAVAEDAARHVQLDIGAEVNGFESAAVFFVAGFCSAVCESEIL